ncbi:uncharacterized protein SCODWIG_00822 [Saccharomycodes ludwigii]|uniref:PH domain-containing protein n=1 Tax=Saccharomycodes ludwigii TaxID=36035 RepID=A0A376B333_9ASCO|nr:hypothetical protein SCDLUD_002775 [Saccharomycodes ludwigii]KAH3901284.1 hypothetical protein SCDLUD_002775 [Saccharomycodes ludwigii]SSD59061.1 uncharacterized protein SCODWIG_00822 [Saccharomycodes ludwigii]
MSIQQQQKSINYQQNNKIDSTQQVDSQNNSNANTPLVLDPLLSNNSTVSTQKNKRNSHVDPNIYNNKDLRSPLVITVPTNSHPTEILSRRFAMWRNIIKSLLIYLNETCSIQDEIVRQQMRLSHAINFPFNNNISTINGGNNTNSDNISINNNATNNISTSNINSSTGNTVTTASNNVNRRSFQSLNTTNVDDSGNLQPPDDNNLFAPVGSGSIQDLPFILSQYHNSMVHSASFASKELNSVIIPRLEDLRRDLLIKIKEIKGLESDFKNTCMKELQQTKAELSNFESSLEQIRYSGVTPSKDPYLCKIILDRQIKKQLHEENFLHEAFINLQTSGKELERVVILEIQSALTQYAKLMNQEAQLTFDLLISKFNTGFVNKSPSFEWDYYMDNINNSNGTNVTFIPLDLPMRHFSKIIYKHQYDPLTYEIQSGVLERRSKFLKSYSKGFYVLTPSFLHEFKTADRRRDLVPVMSLSLNECTIAEHSKRGSNDFKFVLHAKQNGIIHRGHNWVFRADSYDSMFEWFENLKNLTSSSDPKVRSNFVIAKLNLDPVTGRPLLGSLNVNNNNNNNNNNSSNAARFSLTSSSPRSSTSIINRGIHNPHAIISPRQSTESKHSVHSNPSTLNSKVTNGNSAVNANINRHLSNGYQHRNVSPVIPNSRVFSTGTTNIPVNNKSIDGNTINDNNTSSLNQKQQYYSPSLDQYSNTNTDTDTLPETFQDEVNINNANNNSNTNNTNNQHHHHPYANNSAIDKSVIYNNDPNDKI